MSKFLLLPGVELAHTDFEGCPKLGKGIDPFEHISPELLLGSVGKLSGFCDCDFQCPYHDPAFFNR